jgi:hypothetical protein
LPLPQAVTAATRSDAVAAFIEVDFRLPQRRP